MAAMSTGGRTSAAPVTVITPRRGLFHLGLGEVWRYRELGYFLAWRDIKVKYKQTVIGIAWAVLTPIIFMVVFSAVFGRGRGGGAIVPVAASDFVPVWYFSALLPWQYFSQGLLTASNSVVGMHQVITKIYFPRMLLPLGGVFPGLVDFAISCLVLIGLMIGYDVPITARLLVIPLLLVIAMVTAFAAGLWLSATNALYRDVREALPFLVQVLLFVSPVLLPRERVPEWFVPIYGLNPIAGVIEGCRWAVTGIGTFPWEYLLPGLGALVALMLGGLIYFKRIEEVLVDVV